MTILQRLSTVVHRTQGNQLPSPSCPSFPYKLTVTIPYHTYHTPTSHIHYHKPNIVGIHTAHVTNKNKQKKTENMKTRARVCDRKKKTDKKTKKPAQEIATGKNRHKKKKDQSKRLPLEKKTDKKKENQSRRLRLETKRGKKKKTAQGLSE